MDNLFLQRLQLDFVRNGGRVVPEKMDIYKSCDFPVISVRKNQFVT